MPLGGRSALLLLADDDANSAKWCQSTWEKQLPTSKQAAVDRALDMRFAIEPKHTPSTHPLQSSCAVRWASGAAIGLLPSSQTAGVWRQRYGPTQQPASRTYFDQLQQFVGWLRTRAGRGNAEMRASERRFGSTRLRCVGVGVSIGRGPC